MSVTAPSTTTEPSPCASQDADQRAATTRTRPAPVGDEITSVGNPDVDAWAFCLSLANLQAALDHKRGCVSSREG